MAGKVSSQARAVTWPGQADAKDGPVQTRSETFRARQLVAMLEAQKQTIQFNGSTYKDT